MRFLLVAIVTIVLIAGLAIGTAYGFPWNLPFVLLGSAGASYMIRDLLDRG